jgi:hypothetical protein
MVPRHRPEHPERYPPDRTISILDRTDFIAICGNLMPEMVIIARREVDDSEPVA